MRNQIMMTPNKVKLEGEEITDEDIAMSFKKTRLLLERASLKVGLEPELLEEPEHSPEEEAKRQVLLSEIPF